MWILLYLLVFFLSFLVLQGVILISKKYQLFVDSSSSSKPQRFHYRPTSRAGGLGVLVGVLVGFASFGLLSSAWVYFIVACLVIFASGFVEDMGVSLSPKLRLLIQCFGASVACVAMENAWLRDLGLGFEFVYVLGVAFGVFAVVGVCNAMNIIDGFNGLSGGVAACVCVSIIIIAKQVDMLPIAIGCAILLSAILGFLVLNFPKGKVFLGDGGAYLIGFFLAVMLVLLTQEPSSIVSPWYGFCVMIYPVWEVLFSILRRKVIDKKEAMQPDSAHFHTLLFKKLGNNPLTSFILICANAPFIILATFFYANTSALMLTCLVFIIAYILAYRLLVR
ncbi:undecaprenyl/decaprenyl-phosphate alpha-N-acetylglucosaminyl 1-phosphate transferase [Helicobacter sp. XJK30-2]|uniref:Methicillin resistance protein n=2 Tax=Helicobacter TaxID=209 RepID=A0A377J4V4_9HELI|nr:MULTISPECIES: MraY family glycosyltransferase [Helicobacter]MDL0081336.1 undecaprenyl/decaprenyl-phosphate alpha-N-acetylglucosaminyl 1-phosphate transferase [Helicobacter sp. XJK30-2]STO96833.1 methicillin resistance protein [Helicobacter canis]